MGPAPTTTVSRPDMPVQHADLVRGGHDVGEHECGPVACVGRDDPCLRTGQQCRPDRDVGQWPGSDLHVRQHRGIMVLVDVGGAGAEPGAGALVGGVGDEQRRDPTGCQGVDRGGASLDRKPTGFEVRLKVFEQQASLRRGDVA